MSAIAIPAPVGGWNARDSLASMAPEDAVELINLVPAGASVVARPGYAAYSSALGTAVQTLVTYHGTTEKLLCATPTTVTDMTAGSAGTTLGSSFSVGTWQTSEFKNFLIMVNGTNAAQYYNGTTLAPVAIYTVGADVVTNGTFAVDANWTKGTGWTIAAGVASSSGAQVAVSNLYQAAVADATAYEVTYTVTARSAGTITAVLGTSGRGTARSATGTYTEILTSGGSNPTRVNLEASEDFIGSIDNVIIKAYTGNNYSSCTTHKGRVYYIEAASQSFWYPSAGAYAGTLTEFDLAQFTTTGGSLLYMISWSRDGGSGVDDLAVFVFSTGEILVYAGADPGSTTDWSLLGNFRIGAPLGRRSAIKIGGDVVILTVDGYVPLSAALQEGRYSEQSDFSTKIDSAVKDAAQAYQDNFGWESVYWPQASMFIVNVPISASESNQHVRNTTTGSWCKFENIPASCWAVYDDNLYFGSPGGYVYKIAGTSDAGAFITYSAIQAFNYFGNAHRKRQLVAVEPITNFAFPKYLDSKVYEDFNLVDLPEITPPPEGAVSEWNVGNWNVAAWNASTLVTTNTARKNILGQGYALAHVMRWKSKAQSVTWFATHFWFNEIGIV